MDSLAALLDGPAIELLGALRRRDLSATDAVRAYLERIERLNPHIHAVVAMDPEAALRTARAADDALARGETPGPLHGLPFTVKDWLETNDLPCAGGQEERRHYVPARDATVVARMRAAGAILLGKTRPGEDDAVYPRARNPYGLAHTPGGSSAGEAAIIAAAGSPLGLGSDSGGSLRWPAHCSGIATIKPTAGLVPTTGHFPRVGGMADPRTQVGPLARFVGDLEPVLRVIAGPDSVDPDVVPVALGEPETGVAGLRVAMFATRSGITADPAGQDALRAAARALTAAGAEVMEDVPPGIDEALDITRTYWRRLRSYSHSEWRIPAPGALTAEEAERSIFLWDRFRRRMTAFMRDHDLLLSPAAPRPAPLVGETRDLDYVFTLPHSLTGWPAAVVRGAEADGLPVGVQVVAPAWHDTRALAAAAVIERATGGWRPPPISLPPRGQAP